MAAAQAGRRAIIRQMRGTGLQKVWRGQRAGAGAVRGEGEAASPASGSQVLPGEQAAGHLLAGPRPGREADRWGDVTEEC